MNTSAKWGVFVTTLLISLVSLMFLQPGKSSIVRSKAQPKEKIVSPINQTSVLIGWAGDLTPGSRYGLPGGYGRQQLQNIAPVLRSSDIQSGNLEGTLGRGGADKCGGGGGANCFSFQAPPEWARGLKASGFDLMNLANNHAWDFGLSGQRQTIQALRSHNIAWSGRPGEIKIVTSRGVRVAFVGFAPYPWSAPLLQISKAKQLVRQAQSRADLVVVMIHAGAEGSDKGNTPKGTELAFGENRGNSRAFARSVIRSGADLVVGSGPHVVRGMEWYQGKLIAYSTGNFAGWNNFSLGGTLSYSGVLQVRLDQTGKTLKARWVPVIISGPGIPKIDHSGQVLAHVNHLSRQDFGRQAAQVNLENWALKPSPAG